MTKPRILLLAITFILFAIGMVLVLDTQKSEPMIQACTKELRVCADGSTVGRTGPNCSFAECLKSDEGVAPKSGGLGDEIQSGDIRITPIQVVSDSRCPIDVTCIWAGTVTLEARIEQRDLSTVVELTLNEPYLYNESLITLISVEPEARSTDVISEDTYRFAFLVETMPVASTTLELDQ